jgi:hypothetical protein
LQAKLLRRSVNLNLNHVDIVIRAWALMRDLKADLAI